MIKASLTGLEVAVASDLSYVELLMGQEFVLGCAMTSKGFSMDMLDVGGKLSELFGPPEHGRGRTREWMMLLLPCPLQLDVRALTFALFTQHHIYRCFPYLRCFLQHPSVARSYLWSLDRAGTMTFVCPYGTGTFKVILALPSRA